MAWLWTKSSWPDWWYRHLEKNLEKITKQAISSSHAIVILEPHLQGDDCVITWLQFCYHSFLQWQLVSVAGTDLEKQNCFFRFHLAKLREWFCYPFSTFNCFMVWVFRVQKQKSGYRNSFVKKCAVCFSKKKRKWTKKFTNCSLLA